LALQASQRVARARCIPGTGASMPARLLVVPDPGRPAEALEIDDLALDESLLAELTEYLEPRRVLGTSLEISTPTYQGISIAALVRVAPGRATAGVRQRCLTTLWTFLSPTEGGADGNGWPFGTAVTSGALANVLAEVPGVEQIEEIVLFEADVRNGRRLPGAADMVRIDANSLPLGFKLQVVAK
jgi:hypothetical protein